MSITPRQGWPAIYIPYNCICICMYIVVLHMHSLGSVSAGMPCHGYVDVGHDICLRYAGDD